MPSPAELFILLGLRLGRHVDGLVDAYYGPEELSRQVEAEPLAEPDALVEDAETLLAIIDDSWLRDQALGLRTSAGVLAGEALSYSDEVEGCFGIRPQRVSTDVYAAAHDQLDELLPGAGSLADRYEGWRKTNALAPDRVVPLIRDVLAELRARTVELVPLPDGEEVTLESVRDQPWWAFNYYRGDLRSRVVVNVDVTTTLDDVVEVAAHEVYPGHHTEHTVKEQLFVREQGLLEETILLVPTPGALVSECIAETGPIIVLDGDVPERLVAIMRGHGLEYDFEHERAVYAACRPLRRIGLDAALMIHEDGATAEEAQNHLRRWKLVTAEQAAHTVRFVTDPTWRSYVITYSAGRELGLQWADGDPARFARLLTEQVRVRDLVAPVSSDA